MKKILLLFVSLSLFTACENEPLDGGFFEADPIGGGGTGGGTGGGGGSESGDLTLSLYELDTDVTFSLFGTPIQTITRSDLNIANNILTSSTVEVSVPPAPAETETQTYTRNSEGQIISDISVNSDGVTTNEYIITYTDGKISQITYDYFEDDDDDFVYNFTYSGNTAIRTEVGSNISTVFTTDASNRLIKKESFDGTTSIQVETVTYNADGNCSSSVRAGETNSNSTYTYDSNNSPLKVVYDEQYLLSFFGDEYEDEIGSVLAHFHSSKNWNGVNIDGTAYNFNLQYNSANRISSRTIAYNFGSDLSFEFSEVFNYVN